jgi:hypothetical protein
MHFPSWSTFDVFLKIFMPLLTFALGVIATLVVKRVERQHDWIRDQLRAVLALTNDWYNQLIDLRTKSLDPGINSEAMQQCVFAYVHNRIVLPKLLLSLDVLRKSRKHKEIVRLTETFLELVTSYSVTQTRASALSPSWEFWWGSSTRDNQWNQVSLGPVHCKPLDFFRRESDDTDVILSKLDAIIQQMTHVAAALLSKQEVPQLLMRGSSAGV